MKKKSTRVAADRFVSDADKIGSFLRECRAYLGAEDTSWAYEYAVLRLYRLFERFMLESLVAAINGDIAGTMGAKTGFRFPHLTDEACEYLVVGTGYFDFKGRDGLIHTLKRYLPDGHYLLEAVKHEVYRSHLNNLTAFRNYAAHSSKQARIQARSAAGQARIGSAGSWLKTNGRFEAMLQGLKNLAEQIRLDAPY